jgi:hypothetical protein
MRSILLTLSVFATAAQAQSLDAVCGKLIGSQVSDCMAAGNGRYISPQAVGQCGKLIGNQVTSCVQAIAGKEYTPGEAKTCGDLIGTGVVDCFRRTGRLHADVAPADSFRPPTNAEIRAEIAAAVEQIRAHDCAGAEGRLKALLHALR